MNKHPLQGFAALSILLLSLLVTTGARAYSNLYGIGDSLSDIGNLFLATDNNPNFPSPPVPIFQLPQDPPYYNGRFADGPVFIEQLHEALGLGTMSPSFASGTNYAVGGARTRYHTFDFFVPTFDPLNDPSLFNSPAVPFSMLAQVLSLKSDFGVGSGGQLDSDALYSLWIGSNDVFDAISAKLNGAPDGYVNALLQNSLDDIDFAINELVSNGAYYLLLPTVPDLSLVPEINSLDSTEASLVAQTLSANFNNEVNSLLTDIDAKIFRLDTFTFLQDLVKDPLSFGLPPGPPAPNTTAACFSGFVGETGDLCDDPERYVFFDGIHPTAATHEVLGRLALGAVPAPAPVVLVLLGFATIIGWRRAVVSAA